MSELAEGARLEIVYTSKGYPGFKSPSLRHFSATLRRGGRAVECGGLENRFTGEPGNQGSNPCLSAIWISNRPVGRFFIRTLRDAQAPHLGFQAFARVPKYTSLVF